MTFILFWRTVPKGEYKLFTPAGCNLGEEEDPPLLFRALCSSWRAESQRPGAFIKTAATQISAGLRRPTTTTKPLALELV